jgi:hypothetical protein
MTLKLTRPDKIGTSFDQFVVTKWFPANSGTSCDSLRLDFSDRFVDPTPSLVKRRGVFAYTLIGVEFIYPENCIALEVVLIYPFL